jgi:hypothetical protein
MPLSRLTALACITLMAGAPGCYETAPYHGPLAGLLHALSPGRGAARCGLVVEHPTWPAHRICRALPDTTISYGVGRWGRILFVQVTSMAAPDSAAGFAEAADRLQRQFGPPTFAGANEYGLPRTEWHAAGVCRMLDQIHDGGRLLQIQMHTLDELFATCDYSSPQRPAN